MKQIGFVAAGLGALLLLVSFGFDTAPEGTHNIGLLQEQMMLFSLGAVLLLAGVIVAALGTVLGRMEGAGILPPSGYEVSPRDLAAKQEA